MPGFERILVVDVEQACWDDGTPPAEIIEIGVVEVLLSGEPCIGRTARELVRPDSNISAFCAELTGLDAATLKRHGRPFDEVVAGLNKTFGRSHNWCAWGEDNLTLASEAAIHGCKPPFGGRFFNLGAVYGLMTAADKRPSLQSALLALGLSFEGRAHTALADAQNTARVFIEMVRRQRAFALSGPRAPNPSPL